jgi:hypothetical protein
LIRIIDHVSFRSSGWIVVRQKATGERASLAPSRQAQPVNATLGPPCAAPQHRVATITGRHGFQPGGLVASGDHPPFCKPRPPEVDTAKSRRQTFRTVFRCIGRGEGEPTVQPKCVFTGGSSITRMPERHGGWSEFSQTFFRYINGPLQTSRRQILPSIVRWPTGGPRSFRLDDQRPKNSHNRRITGMGTPSNQSKSPRPIAASWKPYGFKTQKGRSGSAVSAFKCRSCR